MTVVHEVRQQDPPEELDYAHQVVARWLDTLPPFEPGGESDFPRLDVRAYLGVFATWSTYSLKSSGMLALMEAEIADHRDAA
jgi:hypothetical protein